MTLAIEGLRAKTRAARGALPLEQGTVGDHGVTRETTANRTQNGGISVEVTASGQSGEVLAKRTKEPSRLLGFLPEGVQKTVFDLRVRAAQASAYLEAEFKQGKNS